jgi:hypothetical protein
VIAAAAVGAGGCSLGGESLSEDQFCTEWGKRECGPVAMRCTPFNVMSCEMARKKACEDFAKDAKGGTRVYRPGNADACLKKVGEFYGKATPITAGDFELLNEICARVFQGTAKANEMCTVDHDCDGSLSCDRAKGRCGARKVVASLMGCANVGEACPRGEFCTKTTDLYLCGKKRGRGMACGMTEPCAEELRCQGGLCADRLDMGAGCAGHDDCRTGYCDPYTHGCGVGLSFAGDSSSCKAFAGAPAPAPVPDGGVAASDGGAGSAGPDSGGGDGG